MLRTVRQLFFTVIIMVMAMNVVAEPFQTGNKTVEWQRAPVTINLPVGKERFVTFPMRFEFGYNTNRLPNSTLRAENDNRTLYLLAKQPFPTERAEAKLNNGEVVLLDITGTTKASDAPVDIQLPDNKEFQKSYSADSNNSNDADISYDRLMRYAVQQLYAPGNVLRSVSSSKLTIFRVPMETHHIVPLFYDNSATAMPLASWQSNNLYVTALEITNNLNQTLALNPKLLCGDWLAASFFPKTLLQPSGASLAKGATTLFVISKQPFARAVQHCI